MPNLSLIRSMVLEGLSDDEIAENLADHEAEIDRYGDPDDDRYDPRAEYHDRLAMGRNDAGEWLGFM